VISIIDKIEHVSQALYSFENKIIPILSIILLPVKCEFSCEKSELNRALNVIHGEILGCQENKYLHFHGLVGTLINQIWNRPKPSRKEKTSS
jgi:hypothetical protein